MLLPMMRLLVESTAAFLSRLVAFRVADDGLGFDTSHVPVQSYMLCTDKTRHH